MRQMSVNFCLLFFLLNSCWLQAQYGECMSGNCKNGYGHFEWTSGEEFIGNFEYGKMDGYGVFYWQSKRKFIGHWKDGKMNGEGILFYENGQIKEGIWKDNTLVHLTRDDFVLSKENILHGTKQVREMVDNRPKMLGLVEQDDIIWQWVVNKFAGEDVQSILYWQANGSKTFPIPTGVNAVHAYPTKKTDGRVWVKNSTSSEAMWAGLIYELYNIKNGKSFQIIEEDAKYWLCSKEEYIKRYAQLEYKAAKETIEFYTNIWLPYCKSKNITPDPQLWFYYLPDTFDEWMTSFTDRKGYPWHPYSGYYDRLVKDVIKEY